MLYLIKIAISLAIIIGAAEVAKKFPALAAMIVALPLTSMLVMCFFYWDSKSMDKTVELAKSIPAAVLPSFIFFFAFIGLAKLNLGFFVSFVVSTVIMLACYGIYLHLMKLI